MKSDGVWHVSQDGPRNECGKEFGYGRTERQGGGRYWWTPHPARKSVEKGEVRDKDGSWLSEWMGGTNLLCLGQVHV
jgi:hypothetical protein